jgi:hypothetical protein
MLLIHVNQTCQGFSHCAATATIKYQSVIVIYNVSIPVVHCMKELTEVEAAPSENDSARLPRCYPDVSAKLLRAAKENWSRMSRNKQLEHV